MKLRSYHFLALPLAFLGVLYTSCDNRREGTLEGVSTIGNPLTGYATLAKSLCTTIQRCNSAASFSQCQDTVMKSSIHSQVGAPTSLSTFKEVAEFEQAGRLGINSAALVQCADSIKSLSCTDPLVLASFNSSLGNPFSGLTNMFPPHSDCSKVFGVRRPWLIENYRYIRASAVGRGDGSDWENACPDFAGACAGDLLQRGYTYYVAAGSYSSITFDVPGTIGIVIKKATLEDHGTDLGWQNVFAEGPAKFPSWAFKSSNWILDGNERSTPTSGHGFQIDVAGLNSNCPLSFCNAIYLESKNHVDNITIRNTEIAGFGVTEARNLTGIYTSRSSGTASNLTFSSGYIHDFGPGGAAFLVAGQGIQAWTFENSVVARVHGMGLDDQGSSNVTIRNNIFENIKATAVILSDNSGGVLTTENMAIYGNIFWQSDLSRYGTSNGVIACINQNICSGWQILNNTIVNFTGPGSLSGRIRFDQAHSSSRDNRVLNNIWFNSANVSHSGSSIQSDYNYYGASTGVPTEPHGQITQVNPFRNWAIGDFRLVSPTLNGEHLPAPFHTDLSGRLRGADQVWDMGAFEY